MELGQSLLEARDSWRAERHGENGGNRLSNADEPPVKVREPTQTTDSCSVGTFRPKVATRRDLSPRMKQSGGRDSNNSIADSRLFSLHDQQEQDRPPVAPDVQLYDPRMEPTKVTVPKLTQLCNRSDDGIRPNSQACTTDVGHLKMSDSYTSPVRVSNGPILMHLPSVDEAFEQSVRSRTCRTEHRGERSMRNANARGERSRRNADARGDTSGRRGRMERSPRTGSELATSGTPSPLTVRNMQAHDSFHNIQDDRESRPPRFVGEKRGAPYASAKSWSQGPPPEISPEPRRVATGDGRRHPGSRSVASKHSRGMGVRSCATPHRARSRRPSSEYDSDRGAHSRRGPCREELFEEFPPEQDRRRPRHPDRYPDRGRQYRYSAYGDESCDDDYYSDDYSEDEGELDEMSETSEWRDIELVPRRRTVRVSEDTQVAHFRTDVGEEGKAKNKLRRGSKANLSFSKKNKTPRSAASKGAGSFCTDVRVERKSLNIDDISVDGRDLPPSPAEPPEVAGWMDKQIRTSVLRRWHRRYFRLSKGILRYYRDALMTDFRDSVNFHQYMVYVTHQGDAITLSVESSDSSGKDSQLTIAGTDSKETVKWAKLLKQHALFACGYNAWQFLSCGDSGINPPKFQILSDGTTYELTLAEVASRLYQGTITKETMVKRDGDHAFRTLAGGDAERRLVYEWSRIAAEGIQTRVSRKMTINPMDLSAVPPYWILSTSEPADSFSVVTDPELRDSFASIFKSARKKQLKVQIVQRVENARTWHRYSTLLQKTASVELDGAATPPEMSELPMELEKTYRLELNEFLVWYGTTLQEARSLARTGFCELGARVLTDCVWKSDEHTKPDGTGTLALLGCRVVCGRVYTDPSKSGSHLRRKSLSALLAHVEADTLLVPQKDTSGWWRTFHVLDAHRLYPEYLVVYTRNDTKP